MEIKVKFDKDAFLPWTVKITAKDGSGDMKRGSGNTFWDALEAATTVSADEQEDIDALIAGMNPDSEEDDIVTKEPADPDSLDDPLACDGCRCGCNDPKVTPEEQGLRQREALMIVSRLLYGDQYYWEVIPHTTFIKDLVGLEAIADRELEPCGAACCVSCPPVQPGAYSDHGVKSNPGCGCPTCPDGAKK
jgi:hypothetical protein